VNLEAKEAEAIQTESRGSSRPGSYPGDAEGKDEPPMSANTKFRMRKLDHESLIRKEIEERKAMVREMNSVRAEPHPLETPLRKEAMIHRPMTVNTEIFEGLGIGENEVDPTVRKQSKLQSQDHHLAILNADKARAEQLKKAIADDANFHLRGRKPFVRKGMTGELDMDPNAKNVSFGGNEDALAAEKRAMANEWMKKSLEQNQGIAARKRAQRHLELAAPEGEFTIGEVPSLSMEEKHKAQMLYAAQLSQDMTLQRAPSAHVGLDMGFKIGGRSRDDRPTTSDRMSKEAAQADYRTLLDQQRYDMERRKADAREANNAPETAPPPYME
jgi:hypothetical protein